MSIPGRQAYKSAAEEGRSDRGAKGRRIHHGERPMAGPGLGVAIERPSLLCERYLVPSWVMLMARVESGPNAEHFARLYPLILTTPRLQTPSGTLRLSCPPNLPNPWLLILTFGVAPTGSRTAIDAEQSRRLLRSSSSSRSHGGRLQLGGLLRMTRCTGGIAGRPGRPRARGGIAMRLISRYEPSLQP